MEELHFMMTGECPPSWYDRYDWTEWGAREKRAKENYPYSYSDHFVQRFVSHEDLKKDDVSAEYSDRMQGWNYEAWKRACDKTALAKRFQEFSKANLSDFLSEYHGKPIEGLAIAEGCNASSGYPYFIFWFREKGKRAKK